ncbi:ATP-binding protein [Paenibacillus sp. PAMC21692]|uniref:ATP-binding protein n=1 Tax=Paenibacillus sp. PAMC21692 TaxID=2762320 RepID=UPI0021C2827B|nr:ATP-binding protein [Paenibacillus sp. PAMC21692]
MFAEWGSMFKNDLMAAALIDRLTHHSPLVVFQGRKLPLETHPHAPKVAVEQETDQGLLMIVDD